MEAIQEEIISVPSSASNDNGGEEQIAMLNASEEIVTSEQTSEQQVTKELLCYGRVLRFITNLNKEQVDGISKLSRIKIYCALLITILFSVLDIGTDVWLMFQYFLGGQYMYGTLTMVFVWVPAFINTYWLYGICDMNKNSRLYQIRKKKWLLTIFYIVPLASVVVAFNNFILFWKSKMDIKDSHVKTVYLLQLQMIESYLEALPQLTLQLCVILNNVEQEIQDTSFTNMLRWVSMAFSVFTVARVQYSYETCYSENIGVKEAATQFISTLFLIVSRVFILLMGFTVSPTVTGVCLLLHSCVVAVAWYRENRELQVTVIGSIIASAQNTIMSMFYYGWYLSNPVIYWKIYARMFSYTVYALQCVIFTTLWCILNSNTRGTVWYYAVPAVPVLLYILCVPAVLLNRYLVKKRIAAERQRVLKMLTKHKPP